VSLDAEEPDDDREEDRRLVAVERVKLSATFFNTLASGCVLAGIVIPATSILVGLAPNGAPASAGRLILSAGVWLLTGAALHFFARRLLGAIAR
jgi:hypothetical protein